MGRGFKIFLIIVLSIIAIALSGILTLLIMRSPKINYIFDLESGYSNKMIQEEEIEELKDIRVNVKNADVVVETGTEEKISIKLYSDDAKEYSIKNGKEINVVLDDKAKVFRLFSKTPRVVITVPSEYENEITVNGTVGDVKVSKLPKATLNVVKGVGDVKVQSINIANIEITTGDVKITKVNELNSKSSTGDVKIGTVNESLSINTNAGDVKIDKANLTKNSSIKNNMGDIKISSINDIYIDAKTNIGSTKINGSNRHSEVELSINSNVGDIKVG